MHKFLETFLYHKLNDAVVYICLEKIINKNIKEILIVCNLHYYTWCCSFIEFHVNLSYLVGKQERGPGTKILDTPSKSS